MTKLIKSPEVYTSASSPNATTLFLAGGITGCPNWQAEVENKLSNLHDLVVFNPRRDGDFNVRDPSWSVQQIEWEHNHLELSEFVLFWFPKEGQCMITLFELGKCMGLGKRVVIGCHPEYVRALDVRIQARLIQPNIPVARDLDELVMNFVTLFRGENYVNK